MPGDISTPTFSDSKKCVVLIILDMQERKYHTVGTIPKSNIKIVEKDKIGNPKTQIQCTYFFHSNNKNKTLVYAFSIDVPVLWICKFSTIIMWVSGIRKKFHVKMVTDKNVNIIVYNVTLERLL